MNKLKGLAAMGLLPFLMGSPRFTMRQAKRERCEFSGCKNERLEGRNVYCAEHKAEIELRRMGVKK